MTNLKHYERINENNNRDNGTKTHSPKIEKTLSPDQLNLAVHVKI